MASRDRAEQLREEARRREEQAAARQREAARKFSDEIDSVSGSIDDLQKSITETLEAVDNAADVKSKNRELEKLNELMSQLESQTRTLQSGVQTLSSSMSDTDREIAEITSDSANQILRNLRNVVNEENRKVEEESKSAEESLREARENARRSSEIYILSQERSRQQLIDSVNKEKEIREGLEEDTRKLLTASSTWERKQIQKRIDNRRQQLSILHSTIDRSMAYLDEVPEGMEDIVRDMHQSADEITETLDNITEDLDETLNDDIISKFSNFCDELRDVAMSLEVDAILQTLTDQVDGFIETRRQILARVGDDFDKEGFSDAVSEAMKDVDYTYSRNEMAAAYKDFIHSTRIQNLDIAENYMSDIAAMQKAYGISADSMKNLIRQDMKSGEDGKMLRSVSNIAASLENNGDLYTSSDSILQALNEKAGLIYGIAQGDSKRQKAMLKSVAAIQALQETTDNIGVNDFNEAILQVGSLGTKYDAYQSETAQQMAQMLGMSIDEVYRLSQESPTELNQMAYEKLHNASEGDMFALSQSYGELFGSSASMKAFAAQDEDEFRNTLDNINKSIQSGDQSETSLAVGKADALTSATDKIGNYISDNFLVRGVSDFFGELDFGLANAAHAAIIAANAGTALKNLGEGFNALRSFFTTGAGATALSSLTSFASAALPVISSGLAYLGSAFTTGISSLGSMLSSLGSSIMSGISTFGPQVAKFALNPITLGIAGAVMTIQDAFDGYDKRTEWLGEERGNTTSGAVASTFGGAIGGTGPGLGQGDLTDVAGNVMGNMAKDAALGAAVGSIIPGIGTAIGGAIGAGVGAVTGLIGGERIANTIKDVWDGIAGYAEDAFDVMDSGVEQFADFTQNLGPLGRSFGNIVEGQWNLLKDTGNEILSIWDDPDRGILSKVGGTLITLAEVPFKAVSNVITGIRDGFTSFFEDLFDGVSDFFSKALDFFDFDIPFFGDNKEEKASTNTSESSSSIPWFSSISSSSEIPGFAAGISEVPNDGIAYLHKGEAVLTEVQAVDARADGGIEVSTEDNSSGTAWQPAYSDLVLAEQVKSILDSYGGNFGYQHFTSMEDTAQALAFSGMSESDIQIFMRNINSIAKDMESMEYNSTKMNEGFNSYFHAEDEDRETNSKFQKALKRFFGLEASDGMAGTSGQGGSPFARLMQSLRGAFGGSGERSGGSSGGGNRGSYSSSKGGKLGKNGNAASQRVTPSKDIKSMGDMSELGDADKQKWEAAMELSKITGIDPRIHFGQFVHESGHEWDWHMDTKNLGGIKYYGQKGAKDSGIDSSEHDANYAAFDTWEQAMDYYGNSLLQQDNFTPAVEAVKKAAAEGASLDEQARIWAYKLKEGGYFGADPEDYYKSVSSIARNQAPQDFEFGKAKSVSTGNAEYKNIGRAFEVGAQEFGDNCTVSVIGALDRYYMGDSDFSTSSRDFGGAWSTLLAERGGRLNAKEYGFDTDQFDDFAAKLKETIDVGQTRPIALYQTGGDGSAGDAVLNNHSGNHMVAIESRTGEDTWMVQNPATGTREEYTTQQLFDRTARGDSQGMAAGSGNALFIPEIEDPNVEIIQKAEETIENLNDNLQQTNSLVDTSSYYAAQVHQNPIEVTPQVQAPQLPQEPVTPQEQASQMLSNELTYAGNALNNEKDYISNSVGNELEYLRNTLNNEIDFVSNTLGNEAEYLSNLSFEDVLYGVGYTYGYATQSLENGRDELANMVGNEIEYIQNSAQSLYNDATGYISSLPDSIGSWVNNELTYVDNQLSAAGSFISNIPSDVSSWIDNESTYVSSQMDAASTFISNLPDAVSQWMAQAASAADQGMMSVYSSVTSWASQAASSVGSFFSSMASSVQATLSELAASAASLPSSIGGWVSDKVEALTSGSEAGTAAAGGSTTGYAEGLSMVPYDNYFAMLHAGEAVLTADQAESLRNSVAPDGGIPIPNFSEYNPLSNTQLDLDLSSIVSGSNSSVGDAHEVVNAIMIAVDTLASKLDAVVSAIGSINLQVASAGGSSEPKDVVNSNSGFIYSL